MGMKKTYALSKKEFHYEIKTTVEYLSING